MVSGGKVGGGDDEGIFMGMECSTGWEKSERGGNRGPHEPREKWEGAGGERGRGMDGAVGIASEKGAGKGGKGLRGRGENGIVKRFYGVKE